MHNGLEIIQWNDKKWQGEHESQTARAVCKFLYVGQQLAANQLIPPSICLLLNQWVFAAYQLFTIKLSWPMSGI